MKFITDMGSAMPMTDENGKVVSTIPRYGVWGEQGRHKPQVIECHDDLDYLKKKHDVPDSRVVKLG